MMEISWLMKRMLVLWLSTNFRNILMMSARTETSSMETGSSTTKKRGLSSILRRMEIRCSWPPDSS